MKNLKVKNEDIYYNILGQSGYSKANEILSIREQREVFQKIEKKLKENGDIK